MAETTAKRVEEPVWQGGLPANLPAAALDALEWLDVLSRFMHWAPATWRGTSIEANRARLDCCIRSLAEHLDMPDHPVAARHPEPERTP